MFTSQTITTDRLQNQGYFQGVIATPGASFLHIKIQHHKTLFLHNLWCCNAFINFLEITLILQPAHSDIKIGPARTQLVHNMEIGYL